MSKRLWFCIKAQTNKDAAHTLERQLEMIELIFPIAQRNQVSHFGTMLEAYPSSRQGLDYCQKFVIYGFECSFTSSDSRSESIVRAIEAISLDQGVVYYGVGVTSSEAHADLDRKKNTVE